MTLPQDLEPQSRQLPLQLIGLHQQVEQWGTTASKPQLPWGVSLQQQHTARTQRADRGRQHLRSQGWRQMHPDRHHKIHAPRLRPPVGKVTLLGLQGQPPGLRQGLSFVEPHSTQILSCHVMTERRQVHGVTPLTLCQAKRIPYRKLRGLFAQEVVGLVAIGIPLLPVALIPIQDVHGAVAIQLHNACIGIGGRMAGKTGSAEGCTISQLSPEMVEELSGFFRLLGEPARLRLMCEIRNGSNDVATLMERTGFSQSHLSRQLGQPT